MGRQQRDETTNLIDCRQRAHAERFGEPMTSDNIWLRGRTEEVVALDGVLLAIERIRRTDGTTVPVRGAGAPQRRLSLDTAQNTAEGTTVASKPRRLPPADAENARRMPSRKR